MLNPYCPHFIWTLHYILVTGYISTWRFYLLLLQVIVIFSPFDHVTFQALFPGRLRLQSSFKIAFLQNPKVFLNYTQLVTPCFLFGDNLFKITPKKVLKCFIWSCDLISVTEHQPQPHRSYIQGLQCYFILTKLFHILNPVGKYTNQIIPRDYIYMAYSVNHGVKM